MTAAQIDGPMVRQPVESNEFDKTIGTIATRIAACEKCPLHLTRTNTVPGHGNHAPRVMFIGEAPGKNEDEKGLPFVGRAGTLLDDLLARAKLQRDEVFIGNILKCRPPKNRNPKKDEIAACTPYLERQLKVLQPRVVCSLGNFAMAFVFSHATDVQRDCASEANSAARTGKTGMESAAGISKVHGQAFHIHLFGRPAIFVPLYHPAATIYNRKLIPKMEADFEKLAELLQ